MYAGDLRPEGARARSPPGVWRSLDSGRTWQLKRAGNATDLRLRREFGDDRHRQPTRLGKSTATLFAAFGSGGAAAIGRSTSPRTSWRYVQPDQRHGRHPAVDPRRPDFPDNPIPVTQPPRADRSEDPPRSSRSFTGNVNQDVQYQSWVYAVGRRGPTAGCRRPLDLTKDLGQSWTRVDALERQLDPGSTNDKRRSRRTTSRWANYDRVREHGSTTSPCSNLSLSDRPEQPERGLPGRDEPRGSRTTALIRVDTTKHRRLARLLRGERSGTDGGARFKVQCNPMGSRSPSRRNSSAPGTAAPGALGPTPTLSPFLNLVRDPNQPFLANYGRSTSTTSLNFSNSGSGSTLDAVRHRGLAKLGGGPPDHHDERPAHRPQARLIVADDQGIFTGVDNSGVVPGPKSGTDILATGSPKRESPDGPVLLRGLAAEQHRGPGRPGPLLRAWPRTTASPSPTRTSSRKGATGYGNLQMERWRVHGTATAAYGNVARPTRPARRTRSTSTSGPPRSRTTRRPPSVPRRADFFKVKPDGGGSEVSRTFNLLQSSGPGIPDRSVAGPRSARTSAA